MYIRNVRSTPVTKVHPSCAHELALMVLKYSSTPGRVYNNRKALSTAVPKANWAPLRLRTFFC